MPRCANLIAVLSLVSTAALARTEERPVPEFDAVNVASGIRVSVEIGPRRPVRVEADDETLSLLETRVEDGALHIGFKPHSSWSGEHRVQVSVQTPQLRAVSASGGSIVRATFTRGRARGIDAGRLSLRGSGGSVFTVQGSADALKLDLSGGSQLHGSDLSVKDVDVNASG